MKRSRFDEHEIVSILLEGNTEILKTVCRRYGISYATYYKWKSKYSGLKESDLRSIKNLEVLNHRLVKMYIQACLEQKILQEAISGDL